MAPRAGFELATLRLTVATDGTEELNWGAKRRQSESGITVDTSAVQTVSDYGLTFEPLEQLIRFGHK